MWFSRYVQLLPHGSCPAVNEECRLVAVIQSFYGPLTLWHPAGGLQAGKGTLLVLEHAGLGDLPQALTRLRTLFLLGLRGNQLATLPPGPYLRGLWCLDLGQQGLLQASPTLSRIPRVLAAATRLETLILDPPYDPRSAVGPLNPSFFNLSHADVVLLSSRLPCLEGLRLTAREGFQVSAARMRQSATIASLKAKRPDVRVI